MVKIFFNQFHLSIEPNHFVFYKLHCIFTGNMQRV